MLRTGNAGVRPREMALPEKRRGGVPAGRFEIWGFCRFPLPCFGSECHTFGLKIATAALRPRNDKDLERFCLGNARFLLYAGNFARCRSVADFNSLIAKVVGFRKNLPLFVSLRGGRICARRSNLRRNETASRNEARQGRAMINSRAPTGARLFNRTVSLCVRSHSFP